MSHPNGLPDLFLDRSLGRIKVPTLLRAAGLRLITLAEHYGIPTDETIRDEQWLELTGGRGWPATNRGSHGRPIPRQPRTQHRCLRPTRTVHLRRPQEPHREIHSQ